MKVEKIPKHLMMVDYMRSNMNILKDILLLKIVMAWNDVCNFKTLCLFERQRKVEMGRKRQVCPRDRSAKACSSEGQQAAAGLLALSLALSHGGRCPWSPCLPFPRARVSRKLDQKWGN